MLMRGDAESSGHWTGTTLINDITLHVSSGTEYVRQCH